MWSIILLDLSLSYIDDIGKNSGNIDNTTVFRFTSANFSIRLKVKILSWYFGISWREIDSISKSIYFTAFTRLTTVCTVRTFYHPIFFYLVYTFARISMRIYFYHRRTMNFKEKNDRRKERKWKYTKLITKVDRKRTVDPLRKVCVAQTRWHEPSNCRFLVRKPLACSFARLGRVPVSLQLLPRNRAILAFPLPIAPTNSLRDCINTETYNLFFTRNYIMLSLFECYSISTFVPCCFFNDR